MYRFRFFKHYLIILSQFLFSLSAMAYDGLELGHNEKYMAVPYGVGKYHYYDSIPEVCNVVVDTYNKVNYSGSSCKNEATGGAVYAPGYGIYCEAINWCYVNGVRKDNGITTYGLGFSKSNCPALNAEGECIYFEKPENNDCLSNAQCDKPECPLGNPIYPSTGKKVQIEVDLSSKNSADLSVTRTYTLIPSSITNYFKPYGYWIFDLDQRQLTFGFDYSAGRILHKVTPEICVALKISNCVDHYDITSVTNYTTVRAFRSDGNEWIFKSQLDPQGNPTSWTTRRYPRAVLEPIKDTPTNITGWRITLEDGGIETYSLDGQLQSINSRNGMSTTFARYLDIDGTTKITEVSHGLSNLKFYKDQKGRILKVTKNNTQTVAYDYVGQTALISKATYADNSTKIYLYEDNWLTQALTGITDERGLRYATWKYDHLGRAISSEHAGGAEKTLFNYDYLYHSTNPHVTVTNSLGKNTKYFYSIDKFRNVIKVEGQPTTNCVGANQDYTYTAEGWIASKTDWKGIETTFTYNATGQEISRTEAFGTPEARTITTEWHPTLFVKTKITEPERETVYNYDASGKLLNQSTRSLTIQ